MLLQQTRRRSIALNVYSMLEYLDSFLEYGTESGQALGLTDSIHHSLRYDLVASKNPPMVLKMIKHVKCQRGYGAASHFEQCHRYPPTYFVITTWHWLPTQAFKQ